MFKPISCCSERVCLLTFGRLHLLCLWWEECMVNISSVAWMALISTIYIVNLPRGWVLPRLQTIPPLTTSHCHPWEIAELPARDASWRFSPIIWGEFDHPTLGPNCTPIGCIDSQSDGINRFTFTSATMGRFTWTMRRMAAGLNPLTCKVEKNTERQLHQWVTPWSMAQFCKREGLNKTSLTTTAIDAVIREVNVI